MDIDKLPIKKIQIERDDILSDDTISWISKDILLVAHKVFRVTILERELSKHNKLLPILREYNKKYAPYSLFLFNLYSPNVFYIENFPKRRALEEVEENINRLEYDYNLAIAERDKSL